MHKITVTTPASSPGLLADICRALADHGVDILDIDIEEDKRKASVVIIAEPAEVAERVLRDECFQIKVDPMLVLNLRDEPGAITMVAQRLKEQSINVVSMHVLHRRGTDAAVALTTANDAAAAEVLADLVLAPEV